jgi:uncharacterized membrane protein
MDFAKDAKRLKHWMHLDLPSAVIAVFFILYCVIFTVLSIKKYQAFNTDLDMGNMLQAFYSTLDGRLMEMTWNGQGENGCMLRGHTELIFLLLIPIFALFPHASTLLFLQTAAIGIGGIAVFAIARHLSRDTWAPVALAASYWLFPFLAAVNLIDFHADSFIIAPYLFAWYFLRMGRFRLFWLCIVLGTLVKEHAFFLNGLLGILLFNSDRKRSVILLVVAAGQFFLVSPLIQWLAGLEEYRMNLAQHVVGDPSSGIFDTLITYAENFWNNLFNGRAVFAVQIALMLNLSMFLFPRGLIMLLPFTAIFIAAGSVQSHRHAILIAPLFITIIEGVLRLPVRYRLWYSVLGVLLPVSFFFLLSRDSIMGVTMRELASPKYRSVFHYRYTPHDAIADSLIQLIPPKVPVASSMPLRTKLVDRRYSFAHPAPADSTMVDFYLFDFFEKREYDDAWPERLRVASLLNSRHFSLMTNIDGLILLGRELRNDSAFLPRFRFVDSLDDSGPLDYRFSAVTCTALDRGYVMKTRFCKGSGDSLIHAFISFFIDPEKRDTSRVLHLASYTLSKLESLSPGVYDESFYFDLPQGRTLRNRRHEVWVYKKKGYLPFFARQEHRFLLVWSSDSVFIEREAATALPVGSVISPSVPRGH